MNQEDYIGAIEEMKTPASKVLEWATIITQKYYRHYNESNRHHQEYVRNLFNQITEASRELVDMIPKVQAQLENLEIDSVGHIFTHILAGPIITMRDDTKLMLALPFWLPETDRSEFEQEHIRYIKKIKNASEYLWSLDRDVVLKMHLEHLDG